MTEKQKPGGDVPVTIAKRAAAEVALGVLGRFETLLAILGMAFASVFLMMGWQFGPLVIL